MSISIYQSDLDQQVKAGLISPKVAAELWKNLSADDANRWRLAWVHLAYAVGGFLILGSITWFTSIVWQEQSIGLFLLASLYTAVFGYAGVVAWYPNTYKLPQIVGGIFAFISVCCVPVAVYGLQRYYDYFPENYPGIFQACSLVISSAVGAIIVPWAPLTAPLYAALFFIAEADAAPLILGEPWSKITLQQADWVSVAYGVSIIIASIINDYIHPNDQEFTFWGYFFGLLPFCGGLTDLYFQVYENDLWFHVGYLVVNLLLMAGSVKLQRVVLLVFGGAGVAIAVVDFLITQATIAESSWFYITFGSILIGSAYEIQHKDSSAAYPFWGYLAGVSVFWGGWTTLMFWPVYTSSLFRITYLIVNVALLAGSVETKQRVFLVFGSIGLMWFIGWLAFVYMNNSWWLPLILVVLGLAFIALAIYYSSGGKKTILRRRSTALPTISNTDDLEMVDLKKQAQYVVVDTI